MSSDTPVRFEDDEEDDERYEEFPTGLSLDALTEKLDALDARVQEEERWLVQEAAKSRMDEEYWATLYDALCADDETNGLPREPTQDDDDDDDDIGITAILAKRRERNVLYYKVKWREQSVTWERADDITAAKTLLTAFDAYLKTQSTQTNPNIQTLSRRERRDRRRIAEESGEPVDYRPVAAAAAAAVGGGGGGWGSGSVAVPRPPPARPEVRKSEYSHDRVRAIVKRCDDMYQNVEDNCCKRGTALQAVGTADREALLAVFNDIILTFTEQRFRDKYGGGDHDADFAKNLHPGSPVPNYFANVGGESIFRRKILSMAGLRNLVIHGRDIFSEMRAQHFSGDSSKYTANTGPEKMRQYTGNTVDLDSVVLRASDRVTLNAINEWNKFKQQPQFSSTQEFGNSTQARQIAITAAETLLLKFKDEFKLDQAQMKTRNVDPASINIDNIPQATTNTDRGRWPIWRYVNVGVDSFHANVPNLDDVNGALLRAPFQCIKGWLYAKESGTIDTFFEDCIVDSCFNMKWKAIEEYNATWERLGTITQVLEGLQKEHQAAFSALFDKDDSEEAEVDEMCRLLQGAKGRDATGGMRLIVKADVAKWVSNPQAQI